MSAVLALFWGALLLLAGAAAAAPVPGSPPPTGTVTVDRGAQHSGEARSSLSRPDTRRKAVAHSAIATAPHEVRPPGHPTHPPAVQTTAPVTAAAPLVSRYTGGPSQERAPPRSSHDPRTSRGPPGTPLDV
ncbi:hypothetical protein ACQEU8_01830 [Streptomyces sp. CA-250714]|uniref:hypothetical protein n=1 Tax=Streptomyces sp. CA-250714 TaxID=3240060 RepID=UPI003D8F787A